MVDVADKAKEVGEGWVKLVREGRMTYDQAIKESTEDLDQNSPIRGIIQCIIMMAKIDDMQNGGLTPVGK